MFIIPRMATKQSRSLVWCYLPEPILEETEQLTPTKELGFVGMRYFEVRDHRADRVSGLCESLRGGF